MTHPAQPSRPSRPPLRDDDRGIAMMTVLLVGALMTALAIAAVDISTSNLQNAARDRVAGGALGAAEAGLAQGVQHMRGASLSCLSGAATCTTPSPWTSVSGVTVTLPDSRTAQVRIELVQAFALPTSRTGRFRITSTGSDGSGRRVVVQDVTIRPLDFPLAVYANKIQLAGTPKVFSQSVLSKDCVGGREKMDFGTPNSTDLAYGIPAAVHSEDVIYEKSCPGGTSDAIHGASNCNVKYPFDQDRLGGVRPDGTGGTLAAPCRDTSGGYPQTSYFGPGDLESFGATDVTPLLPGLKQQAVAMGQYWTSATGWTPPNPAVRPHAVLYFKLGKDETLSLQNELDAYTYDCSTPRSLVIVVDNGSVGSGGVHMNSNNNLSGALLVPRGNFQYNGGATWTGPIFANTIDKWNGTAKSQLTQCYLDNFPPGLLDLGVEGYHEVDAAS